MGNGTGGRGFRGAAGRTKASGYLIAKGFREDLAYALRSVGRLVYNRCARSVMDGVEIGRERSVFLCTTRRWSAGSDGLIFRRL